MTTIIFSNTNDLHSDEIEKQLKLVGKNYLRINTDSYGDKSYIRYSNNQFTINVGEEKISENEIDSVLVRKPHLPVDRFKAGKPSTLIRNKFRLEETNSAIKEFLLSLDESRVVFVNNPINSWLASNKIRHMLASTALGFVTPKTLVTSNSSDLQSFYYENNGLLISKVLKSPFVEYGNKHICFHTERITKYTLNKFIKSGNSGYPILVQEEVKKVLDLRINVVGDEVFACGIDSQKKLDSITDWRKVDPYSLTHTNYNLPEDIKTKCLLLTKHLGLNFGAIDMALDINGRYLFFEINPTGQYLWIEKILGHPISRKIADLLTGNKS